MRKGWRRSTLGEIADVYGGGTPSTTNPDFWGGDIPWITPTEVVAEEGNAITHTERTITQLGLDRSGARLLPARSVLVTSRATVGAVALAAVPIAINQGFAGLVCHDDLIPEWLMLWCQANRREFRSRAGGSTFPEVSRLSVRGIPITVPPLQQQCRAVDFLESIDCARLSALRVKAAASAVLTALSTECWSLGASAVPLGELGPIVTGTTPPTVDAANWTPSEVPFFTPGDFGGRLILAAAERAVSRKGAALGRALPVNSVAMVCIGATLGKSALLAVSCVTNQQINALVGLDDEDALYLAAILASPRGQTRAWASSGRTTIPILNKSRWSGLRVPWPDRSVRVSYAGLLRACEAAIQAAIVDLSALAVLRQAALDDLFLVGVPALAESYDRFLEPAS